MMLKKTLGAMRRSLMMRMRDPEIGERALQVLRRHLETLAGPLVILSLAAERVDTETKEAMGRRLHAIQHEWNPGQMPLRRADAPDDFIHANGYVPEEWIQVDTYLILLET